ncbi:NAD(P)H-hydrate dehydratase [Ciceribacter sp. L1K22]|uniref:NAD(P)H-hydrate dehydratase n=1 Tax=Ciceribacter sp. L1K22 TaxID=2820275 RepID=UPI001ABE2CC5|nr:NAD(P)H-hydrate dehydratase [Ciceribacter sp. L1K22]MBO3760309.1 NAD(P)H-hydrate dehydratase [Ciceribacter sp. L1K22]
MTATRRTTLLTPLEMAAVDRAAAASGIDSYGLMERAGRAVSASVLRHFPYAERVVVFCGPGNNGGDGYVVARDLAASGVMTAVYCLGDPQKLRGDARKAFENCGLVPSGLESYEPKAGDVLVDAIFGAGLDRSVPAEVGAAVKTVADAGIPVVAVDLPSGLDGRTGAVRGAAFIAAHTITFMTRKPGHLLLPGRNLCGAVEVVDIGIPWRIVSAAAGSLAENDPDRWLAAMPRASAGQHKFSRGHLAVFSGPANATGAARLTASAALRVGAGLVTLASPRDALEANAAHLTAVMLKEIGSVSDLRDWGSDDRLNAFVLGPGFGIGQKARDFTIALGEAGKSLVLDADGITSFSDGPTPLFKSFGGGPCRLVLTPHEGEFSRLFPDIAADPSLGKIDKAVRAAERANAAVIYKGADSVIAAPDGRALINTNAPPQLATAGSGDVLAGIVGGLLAQGVPAFEAAAAGVWLHGQAAKRAGRGLTAETLVETVEPP